MSMRLTDETGHFFWDATYLSSMRQFLEAIYDADAVTVRLPSGDEHFVFQDRESFALASHEVAKLFRNPDAELTVFSATCVTWNVSEHVLENQTAQETIDEFARIVEHVKARGVDKYMGDGDAGESWMGDE